MEKIIGLLHEESIIDLKMLFRLIRRYKSHFLFAFVFFCFFFSYLLYTQPIVYYVSVPVQTAIGHRVANDLSDLKPVESAAQVNLEELNISISSFSFLEVLAGLVIQDPSFISLNFRNNKSRSRLLGSDIAKICASDKTCLITQLTQSLKDLFYVEQGLTENRFTLVVNSTEKRTAQTLAAQLVKAIELERIKIRQYTVLKEIKSVESLIDESQSVIQKMGGYEAIEQQEKLQNNIADLKERIRMLQSNISIEKTLGTHLQAKLSEYKKTTKNQGASKEGHDSYLKAQARINEIKINVNHLTNLPEDKRSTSDNVVISQLLEERSRLLKIIPSEWHIKSIELNEKFKDRQRENYDNAEFEYLVSQNKISKLETDYEASKSELNVMMNEKLMNESKVNGMKSDLDFLKNLETKKMSLKLLNATMNSDLIFEYANRKGEEFRRSSYFKIFLFSFGITAFLYLISIFVRYSNDDRIYGEEEIGLYFKELDLIGDVPVFD